jgi:hypothetical protein
VIISKSYFSVVFIGITDWFDKSVYPFLKIIAIQTSHKYYGMDKNYDASLLGSLIKQFNHSKPIFIQMGCDFLTVPA